MARKKLNDAQKQFISGDGNLSTEALQQANAEVSTIISDDVKSNLQQQFFGDRTSKESTIRFTVDIPDSLNKRLAKLSLDTDKPKTELVRFMLSQSLTSLNY